MDFRLPPALQRATPRALRILTRGGFAAVCCVAGLSACRSQQGAKPAALPARTTLEAGVPSAGDADGDGLDDAREDALAAQFAPVIFHGERETTFPTSVDSWLALTHLALSDRSGAARRVIVGP